MSGGIPFDALYGNAGDVPPEDQLVREGSAARRIEVALNTTPPAPFALDFAARTVLVDNASGAWYQVNGRWIPPWTIGAVILLDLPAVNLEVIAGPPAGHFSVLAGEPLLLIAMQAQLAPHPGQPTVPHRSLVAYAYAWDGGGVSGHVESLLPTQTGQTRVMVDAITTGPYFAAGGNLAPYNLIRDEMTMVLWAGSAGLGPSTTALAIGSLTPEQPHCRLAFEPGAIITELARSVGIEVGGLSEAGRVELTTVLEYRLVVTA